MRARSPFGAFDVNDWRWWTLALVPLFVILTLLIETPRFAYELVTGVDESMPSALYDYASCWGSWLLLAPALFWCLARFPIGGRTPLRHAVLHVALALAFIAAHLAMHVSFDFIFAVPEADSFATQYLRYVRYMGPFEIIVLLMIDGLFHAVRFAIGAKEAAERERELRHLKTTAELEALRRRLEPHFLFNALNSLCAMLPEDAPPRQMAARLSDYLRLVLDRAGSEMVTLREEMALVHSYLEVESVRHGPRLVTKFQVSGEVMDAPTPVLMLQPLVENAVRHATAGDGAPASVQVEARRANGDLLLAVTNSYIAATPRRSDGGQGHAIIRERLRANYGPRADLRVTQTDTSFSAQIILPLESAP